VGSEAHKWFVLTRYIHKQHVHGSFKLADFVTTCGYAFELQKKLKTYFNIVMLHAGDQILFLMLNSGVSNWACTDIQTIFLPGYCNEAFVVPMQM
jgi:hypothetical protein